MVIKILTKLRRTMEKHGENFKKEIKKKTQKKPTTIEEYN